MYQTSRTVTLRRCRPVGGLAFPASVDVRNTRRFSQKGTLSLARIALDLHVHSLQLSCSRRLSSRIVPRA